MSHSEGDPMISVQCKCGQKLNVKPEYAGRKARCPACSEAIQIPEAIDPSKRSPLRSHAETASQDTVPVVKDRKATRPVISGEIMPNEQAEVQPTAYSRPQNVQVNVDVQTSRGAHSLGVASLVVAILSFFVCWLPFVGFGFAGLAFVLGIAGVLVAIVRKGTGIGYSIAGAGVSLVSLMLSAVFTLFFAGAVATVDQAVKEVGKDRLAQPAAPRPDIAENVANHIAEDDAVEKPDAPPVAPPVVPPAPNVDEPDTEQAVPLATFHKSGSLWIKLTIARVDFVEIKSMFGGDTSQSAEKYLLCTFHVRNTDERKIVTFHDGGLGTNHFSMRDDVDNSIRGVSMGFSDNIVGAISTGHDLQPGEEATIIEVFKIPPPKTKHLILSVDLAAFSGEGKAKFKLPASEIKGFSAQNVEAPEKNKDGITVADQPGDGFQQDSINAICAYLEEDGHKTYNPYRQEEGGDGYYACSPYKDISPNSLNHIAYYVNGTRTKVSAINLDLNVHDLSGASAANGELLASGEKLVRKATGNPLPDAARKAIMAGRSGEWQIGPATIRLKREDYVTGRGYSLNLLIEWK